jgi:hypothetical protein
MSQQEICWWLRELRRRYGWGTRVLGRTLGLSNEAAVERKANGKEWIYPCEQIRMSYVLRRIISGELVCINGKPAMGELSGSFNLDPGEISYAICVADAADFFNLPPEISADAVMIDGPVLSISIKRRGTTKTVRLYDSGNLGKHSDIARFLRVWDRIFKPLPVRPAWNRGS